MSKKSKIVLISLCILLIALFVIHLLVGSSSIPAGDVFSILFGSEHENQSWISIVERRFTRAGTSVLACGALALSGLVMQTIFKNPLSGPSVLGITSGSSLGVAIVFLLIGNLTLTYPNLSNILVFIASILGALLTLILVLLIGRKVKNNTVILIAGMMFSYLASAIVNILVQQSEATNIKQYVFWGLGSFTHVDYSEMLIFAGFFILAFVLVLLKVKFLNLSLLGEKYARSMGVNSAKNNRYLIVVVGVLTGIVVSFCGPIAFVGIAVPHITKLLFKTTDHKKLLVFVVLIGAILGLLASILSEAPFSIPVNSIMSLIGAPVILFVLLKNRKSWMK